MLQKIINYLKNNAHEKNDVFYYLPNLNDFKIKEKEFHDHIHADEEEIHQLNTLRNRYYHDYFKKFLLKMPLGSVILELGTGSGNDLGDLAGKGFNLIASDLSEQSVISVKNKYKNNVLGLVADGQNLPLPDNSVDAAFAVATFHHFEDSKAAINEILRVTKPGGLVILAMEPSRFMMKFTKLFKNNKNLRIYEAHSEADETHKGFNKSDFTSIINPQSSILKFKRVWLTLGFLHYGLEGIYRVFKLKKRLKAPIFLEWILLIIDEILLKIPIINWLNWHWIIIAVNHK